MIMNILGRETTVVTPGERRCSVRFGALEAGYAYIPEREGAPRGPFNWWITVHAHEHRGAPIDGSEMTEAGAVAAIERALLSIRAAIPEAAHELSPEERAVRSLERRVQQEARELHPSFEDGYRVGYLAALKEAGR